MAMGKNSDGWERCCGKAHSHYLHGDQVDGNTGAMGEIPRHIQDPNA
jgi:hypothetical protein